MENAHSLTKISHPPRNYTKKLTKIDPIGVEATPFSERRFKERPMTTYCCTETSRTPCYVCISMQESIMIQPSSLADKAIDFKFRDIFYEFQDSCASQDRRTGRLLEKP